MKQLFVITALLLNCHLIYAQKKDSFNIKSKYTIKTEFAFKAMFVKENINKYFVESGIWAPGLKRYRNFETPIGHEFGIGINLSLRYFFANFGIGYRRTLLVYYLDGFIYNSLTGAETNNLKIIREYKKAVLDINIGYAMFKRKNIEVAPYLGFQKNIVSNDSYKAINKDYYKFIEYDSGSFQDFERIGVQIKKKLGYLYLSVPIEIEVSYSKAYYKSIFFYYKTGLIISF